MINMRLLQQLLTILQHPRISQNLNEGFNKFKDEECKSEIKNLASIKKDQKNQIDEQKFKKIFQRLSHLYQEAENYIR